MKQDEILILLVDDDKTVLDSLGAELSRMFPDHFEVECAESAEEGWEVLTQARGEGIQVVVVVSDWLMPGERGDEFLAKVRESFPTTGRILLTGHADPEGLRRAQTHARVHEILFKPWRPESLRDAIQRAMTAPA